MTTIVQGPYDQSRVIVRLADGRVFLRDGQRFPRPRPTGENVDPIALSGLLYHGAIVPPRTIFNGHAALAAGSRLEVTDGHVRYEESDQSFCMAEDCHVDRFDPIHALSQVMERRQLDYDRCILLLSEGKDSTGVALALAELGKKVDCLTFANEDTNVDLIRKNVIHMGHRWHVHRYKDFRLREENLAAFANVFEPNVDQAILAYFLVPLELFRGRIILDGMGNDIYMGHLPTKQQLWATRVCECVRPLVPTSVAEHIKPWLFSNRSYCGLPLRTFSECQGLYNGFGRGQLSRCLAEPPEIPLDVNWRALGFERARAMTRGRYLDTYSYQGKSLALGEMAEAEVVFPWASPDLAKHFLAATGSRRYDWPQLNKVPLRDAIAKRIPYQQPKVGFAAPVREILNANRELVEEMVIASNLIPPALKPVILRPSRYLNRIVAGLLIALWENACASSGEVATF